MTASHSRSIAIVDDHVVFRRILARSLSRILPGCRITEAENGKRFLDQLQTQTFDLVLMDVKMPVMDGIEATRIATQGNPGLKILALSMYDDPEFVLAMQKAGAAGYLTKGSDQKKMKEVIRHILEGGTYFRLNETTHSSA